MFISNESVAPQETEAIQTTSPQVEAQDAQEPQAPAPIDWLAWKPTIQDESLAPYSPKDAELQAYAPLFQELNMQPEQANKLAEMYAKQSHQAQQAFEQQMVQKQEETKALFQKEWGDQFEQRIQRIETLLEQHGGDELFNELKETGVGYSPRILKLLDNLANQLTPPPVFTPETKTPPQSKKEQWNSQPTELRQAFINQFHPEHEKAKATFARIHNQ